MATIIKTYNFLGINLQTLKDHTYDGVTVQYTNFTSSVDVTYDDAQIDVSTIDQEMKRKGFEPAV